MTTNGTPQRSASHEPVMVDLVVDLLSRAPGGLIVDATLGAGGHAYALCSAGDRRVLGIDRDPHALELARGRLEHLDVTLVRARFDELPRVLDEHGADAIAGALFDLGLSSMQLDRAERGFSYRADGPLDMRMDPDLRYSAADLVNDESEDELARVLRDFGEERFARRIAAAIVRARPIGSTAHLAEIVRTAIPAAARRTGGHPATRTFQALRIAVNGELDALRNVLPSVIDRLLPGGVLVVISYHSLEDRIVKHAFVQAARGCVCPPGMPVCGCGRTAVVEPLVRRVARPSEDEVGRNPRARSARLRAVRRLEVGP